ncbi:hypothetical protein VDGL01_09234 [Verticillium dahliae]
MGVFPISPSSTLYFLGTSWRRWTLWYMCHSSWGSAFQRHANVEQKLRSHCPVWGDDDAPSVSRPALASGSGKERRQRAARAASSKGTKEGKTWCTRSRFSEKNRKAVLSKYPESRDFKIQLRITLLHSKVPYRRTPEERQAFVGICDVAQPESGLV